MVSSVIGNDVPLNGVAGSSPVPSAQSLLPPCSLVGNSTGPDRVIEFCSQKYSAWKGEVPPRLLIQVNGVQGYLSLNPLNSDDGK